MKYLYLALFFLVLLGCNNSSECNTNKFNSSDFYFDKAEVIQGIPLKENYPVMFSFECFYTPDGFLGSMDIHERGLVHLADLNTGELISSVCHKGRGPKELLTGNPHIDIYNNTLYVTDMVTDRIKGIIVDSDSLVVENIAQIKYPEPTITANASVVND